MVYSDGGRLELSSDPRVGGGLAISQPGRLFFQKCIPLNSSLRTFGAEAATALVALEIAFNLLTARFTNKIWTLLDNLDVAR